MPRVVGATLFTLCLAAWPAGSARAAPRVHMWQTRDTAVTEGFVDVEATPAELYGAITDYPRWPALLSDIEWVKHKQGGREDAQLHAKSRTYGNKAALLQFKNRPWRLVHFAVGDSPPGVTLWEQITFEPNRDTGLTRVRVRMHISVRGVLGWLTTDAKVRKYRERKVLRDLQDMGKRWAPKPKPPSQPATRPS